MAFLKKASTARPLEGKKFISEATARHKVPNALPAGRDQNEVDGGRL